MFHASIVDLDVGDYLQPNADRLYGTKEEFQCLFFGNNQRSLRDLGSIISTLPLKNGKLGIEYTEHFPNIFNTEFKDKTAFVYEVDDKDFVQGGWRVEFYTTKRAKILSKKQVNLYDEIMKNVKLGNVSLKFYSETKEHIQKLVNHLLEMTARKVCDAEDVVKLAKTYKANPIAEYFPGIVRLNENLIKKLPSEKVNFHK